MYYKLDVFEEGKEYTTALTLIVCAEDKNDLERILLENDCSVRISKAEVIDEEDDF